MGYMNAPLMRREQNPKNDDKSMTRMLASDCSIRAMEGEGNERKFEISFSSEEPYDRWFGPEILSHAKSAVDLSRLNTIGCVLFNHDRDRVIGKIIRAWIEDNRCKAEIEMDEDEDSEIIYQKMSTGTLKGVSVGYVVNNWEVVKEGKLSLDGRFKGPCQIAKKWVPFEVSIVSVPADPTVGVGRSVDPAQEETEEKGVSSFYFCEKQLQINNNLQ